MNEIYVTYCGVMSHNSSLTLGNQIIKFFKGLGWCSINIVDSSIYGVKHQTIYSQVYIL